MKTKKKVLKITGIILLVLLVLFCIASPRATSTTALYSLPWLLCTVTA